MKYDVVKAGRFIARPNRFIAQVEMDGRVETVHVKNTGRCRELLVPGATVYLSDSQNPKRKTRYDLIAVQKGERLINMDSQAPNAAVLEWLRQGNLFPAGAKIKPEYRYGDSRFDFGILTPALALLEVKGVTLVEARSVGRDMPQAACPEYSAVSPLPARPASLGSCGGPGEGAAFFPDAPTMRGARHLRELAAFPGESYALFVIQTKDVDYFAPNDATDPAFAQALREAYDAGVHILAYDCHVTPDSMTLADPVEVRL